MVSVGRLDDYRSMAGSDRPPKLSSTVNDTLWVPIVSDGEVVMPTKRFAIINRPDPPTDFTILIRAIVSCQRHTATVPIVGTVKV